MTAVAIPARRLVTGSGARLVARGFGVAVSLVTTPLLARHLGPEGYGYLAVIVSVVALLAMAGEFGLPLFAGRAWPFLAVDERDPWLGSFWQARHLLTFFCFALGLLVALLNPFPGVDGRALAVAVLGLPLVLTGSAAAGLFDAHLDPLPGAASELVGKATWLIAVLSLVAFTPSVTLMEAVLAGLAAQLVTAVLLAGVARKEGLLRWPAAARPARLGRVLAQTLPLAALPLMSQLYFRADTLVLAAFAPPAHVGIYGLEWRIVEVLISLVSAAAALFVPLYATMGSAEDQQRAHDRLVRLLAMGTFPAAATIAVLAHPIMAFIGGSAFVRPDPLTSIGPEAGLVMLMCSFALMSVGMVNGPLLIARGRLGAFLGHLAFLASANILLNLLLVPTWSLWGAAATTVVTSGIGLANSSRLVRRAGLRPRVLRGTAWPALVAAAAVVIVVGSADLPWPGRMMLAAGGSAVTVLLTPLRNDLRWLIRVSAGNR